jgi:endo-1,4-beta-xylanase
MPPHPTLLFRRSRFFCYGAGLLLATVTGLSAGPTDVSGTMGTSPPLPALHAAYREHFAIGLAVSRNILRGDDPVGRALADRHFNSFTPENSLKAHLVQPREGEFDFREGDALVALATAHQARAVGHALLWHEGTPAWFFADEPDRDTLLTRLHTHIDTVVGRYRGRIAEWDVVNEALADGPGEAVLRDSPWRRVLGDDYVAQAFRRAHAADPDAVLIYNDYLIERSPKRERALTFLSQLLDEGVPVHAVGIQGHWGLDGPPVKEIAEAIRLFGALGLRVMITELDVSVLPYRPPGANISIERAYELGLDPYREGLPTGVQERLAERYEALFRVFVAHRDLIDRVTFWGDRDANSWLNNWPIRGRINHPLLFDRAGQPKPAFHRVLAVPTTGRDE